MKADIIIPTYRPDDTFCLLLQKLQEQTFVVHRVIILNTERELWESALEKYPIEQKLMDLPCEYELIHVKKTDFDHGGTRMLGASHSTADVMVFMTQDAVPADEYLIEQLVKGLDNEDTAVAYARQLPNDDCSVIERYTRSFNYPDIDRRKGREDIKTLGIKTFFCSDVCAAYRKELFEKIGGFEEPVIFNEDMFFAAAAIMKGYYVQYAAKAKVKHSHNYTVKQQFHRNFDLAVSQQQHPEIFESISSEAEGMKLVKSTVNYLCRIKKPYLIVSLGFQCIGKYAGYWMGKRYQRLSRKRILKYTMNRDFWCHVWNKEEHS